MECADRTEKINRREQTGANKRRKKHKLILIGKGNWFKCIKLIKFKHQYALFINLLIYFIFLKSSMKQWIKKFSFELNKKLQYLNSNELKKEQQNNEHGRGHGNNIFFFSDFFIVFILMRLYHHNLLMSTCRAIYVVNKEKFSSFNILQQTH